MNEKFFSFGAEQNLTFVASMKVGIENRHKSTVKAFEMTLVLRI